MNSRAGAPLVLGRVRSARGRGGEVTVTVVSGEADRWVALPRVVLRAPGAAGSPAAHRVESARAYRDRLVLKLAGIDDAGKAAALRGKEVCALADDLPELPSDVYWAARLVGLRVSDASLGDIGRVVDVLETGGVDVMEVRDDAGVETLIPLARTYMAGVDERGGTIRVTLPADLRGLNSGTGRDAE